MDQRRHRFCAGPEEVQAIGLEPVRMAAGVDVPVDDAHLWVPRGRLRDVVVHREVRMPRSAQRQPEDPFDAGGGERVDRVLDVARVLVFEVVVADRDDHGVAELRAHRLDELDGARRAHALIRAPVTLDPPARRHLEVEVDALPKDRDRAVVARDRVGDRVADERHVLDAAGTCG